MYGETSWTTRLKHFKKDIRNALLIWRVSIPSYLITEVCAYDNTSTLSAGAIAAIVIVVILIIIAIIVTLVIYFYKKRKRQRQAEWEALNRKVIV